MFCAQEFDALLRKTGKTKDDIAKLLGVNAATIYRKINGTSDFTRAEIQLIRSAFDLDNAAIDKIFFADELE